MTLQLHYMTRPNRPEQDALNRIFDCLCKGWPGAVKNTNRQYHNQPGAYWGIIENNAALIQQHQQHNTDWWFWDMPYWGRYTRRDPNKTVYWRVSKNSLHFNQTQLRPSDRFEQWNLHIQPWRKSGDVILVCPSSPTMTRWYTGKSDQQWTNETVERLKQYTNRPIRIRNKPRSGLVSGPDAAEMLGMKSFAEELKDVFAVVTTVSLGAVEAVALGVPVFCIPESYAAPIGCTDLSQIQTPVYPDREPWFNHLAYCQYNYDEIENGTAYRLLSS